MPHKINTPPLGLQKLLGSRTFGINPDELDDKVSAGIDLLPFYGVNLLRNETSSGGRTSIGDAVGIVMPGRAGLLAVSTHVTTALTAAETLGTAISLKYIDGNAPTLEHWVTTNLETYTNPAAPITGAHTFDGPLIVEAGTQITARYWYKSTANSLTTRLSVLYYDLSNE